MEVYNKQRTRATTWVPRRVFYVRRFLERTLTAGKAQAISNKQIQLGVRFGSEGEVSQIMRWLAGEQPTMGRWAYGHLQATTQTYRFITRERLPSGGYSVTLLATPERIDAPAVRLPQIVQMSFLDDPSMIPPAGQQDASAGGSFSHDPLESADLPQQGAADPRSQRDHPKETQKTQNQEEKSGRSALFERLMIQPGMSRKLAQQIANAPIGTCADFEGDLTIAETFARNPFFFTVAKWRDGQRVVAPEEPRHEQPTRSSTTRSRRSAKAHQPSRSTPDQTAADYAALLAEIVACNPDMQV